MELIQNQWKSMVKSPKKSEVSQHPTLGAHLFSLGGDFFWGVGISESPTLGWSTQIF